MSSYCISTENVDYSFSINQKVLDDVSIKVPEGSIYGFLGHNGAGKTTFLRLLLGLLKKQKGSVCLFGHELTANRLGILRKLGSLIEQPSLYLHLTAIENLEIFRQNYQCNKSRIKEVLKIVGLSDAGSKKAKAFSLGMKQRLAIAIALLHDPELLILDEPTNGLDPGGIIEARELIIRLNRDYGKTILVSSHMLNEVERMVTQVGIIHRGRMLFQGTLSELQETRRADSCLEVEVCDGQIASEILESDHIDHSFTDGLISIPYESKEKAALINTLLVGRGLQVYQMAIRQHDLEKVFIKMTSEN